MEIETLFCKIDDFCQAFAPIFESHLLPKKVVKRKRKCRLCLSEIATIVVYFHSSGYRNFKKYYINHIFNHCRSEFPNLVSYNRFVELIPSVLMPLILYLNTRKGEVTGISFIDSTRLPICSNFRATKNQVFEGLANWGKSSIGWFFGFKLHLIINDKGELLSFQVTPGNVDDRVPVKDLVQELFGKLYGDKGYISSPLFEELFDKGIKFITPFRKNMKNRLLPMIDKIMLRKRSLIETVNDQLKNISQISHSRHRSVVNFMVNIIAGLIAYTHQEKKPSLNLFDDEYSLLPSNLIPSESFLF
ncbi:MAG TPA: IS982 family transposase [Cyanothece sp. UBA12306]|nr:IS982 family transposase [Cyanothece sp. UBA12306]